jgi:hypothetical protein
MVSYVVCATMGEDCVTLGRVSYSGPFEPVPTSFAHPHRTLEEAERTAEVCPLPTLIIEFDLATERCCDPRCSEPATLGRPVSNHVPE